MSNLFFIPAAIVVVGVLPLSLLVLAHAARGVRGWRRRWRAAGGRPLELPKHDRHLRVVR